MRIAQSTYLKAVAVETARMSYPGRMGGMLKPGAKRKIQEYFEERFPLPEVWRNPKKIAGFFDDWHRRQIQVFASFLEKRGLLKQENRAWGVASKLLNTYLHQLMKYPKLRPLYGCLHLPLDQEVRKSLRRLAKKQSTLHRILLFLQRNFYEVQYDEYLQIQDTLSRLMSELPINERKLTSRIELNALLWAINLQARHQALRRSS